MKTSLTDISLFSKSFFFVYPFFILHSFLSFLDIAESHIPTLTRNKTRVLVHLRTKFQLHKSKFAWVRQFWENSQKIKNLKKFEPSNRFRPNLIPKFLDRYNIFLCRFRMKAQILRKLELPRPVFKKFKIT